MPILEIPLEHLDFPPQQRLHWLISNVETNANLLSNIPELQLHITDFLGNHK